MLRPKKKAREPNMKQSANQDNGKKKLPKFQARTLRPEDLHQVRGGLPGDSSGTRSQCCLDGNDEPGTS